MMSYPIRHMHLCDKVYDISVLDFMLAIKDSPLVNLKAPGGTTLLLRCAVRHRADLLAILLDLGADPNILDNDANPALTFSPTLESDEIVEMLLKAGADPNLHGPNSDPCLITAVLHGSVNVVKMLLEAGADPDKTNKSALEAALYRKDTHIVEILLAYGADMHKEHESGYTPWQMAQFLGDVEIFEIFQKHDKKESKD